MSQPSIAWRYGASVWIVGILVLALLLWGNSASLDNLLTRWNNEEEYSHGYLIPMVSLLFLWEQTPRLRGMDVKPSWLGVAAIAVALLLFLVGDVTALYALGQFSILLALLGLSLALLGTAGTRLTYVPILLLVFAIPLPGVLEAMLTAKLQLVSTTLGVGFIRLCDIPVYREGNLIDLGVYKLEVAEACSGLTYLYPLLWFGCIFAYMYHAPAWKKAVVIVSSIPIAILLNSVRIGAIGVLVHYYGTGMAEGFIHAFEGWVVFMVCVVILMSVIWLLTKLGADRRPFREVFGIEIPGLAGGGDGRKAMPAPLPYLVGSGLIAVFAVASAFVAEREELPPPRALFSGFPLAVGGWQGKPGRLEQDVLKVLKLTDYVTVDYQRPGEPPINFYVAYYASQRKGVAPHSPTVCIPGGGMQLTDLTQRELALKGGPPGGLSFNRAVIRQGDRGELMYYWYHERGRGVASEYWAKWYLLRDAVLMNRTDGALVRLITPIAGGDEAEADKRLTGFVEAVLPLLPRYVPD